MAPGADDGGNGERHVSEARRRLEAIRRALNADMAAKLARLNTRGGVLASEREDLDAARRVRADVLALLREDGLPVVIATAEAQVADAIDDVLRGMPSVGGLRPIPGTPLAVTFDADAKASIARSVSGVLDEVTAVFKDGAKAIQRAVDLGANTAAPLSEVTQAVAEALDVAFNEASTAVETAIRGASRAALVQQAERGGEAIGEEMVYLYDGPDDGKIRDFCSRRVGNAYTLDALKRLDNGMGLPVEVYAGGWQCRHRLSPLLRSDAEEEGIPVYD